MQLRRAVPFATVLATGLSLMAFGVGGLAQIDGDLEAASAAAKQAPAKSDCPRERLQRERGTGDV